MARWLVDGSNVVGSRPDGWWRDRRAAFRRLTGELASFARSGGHELTVVFDGDADGNDPHPEVVVAWAPSADDRITSLVRADGDPSSLTVVTSDRELRTRVEALGAAVSGAGTFRRRLDGGGEETRGPG